MRSISFGPAELRAWTSGDIYFPWSSVDLRFEIVDVSDVKQHLKIEAIELVLHDAATKQTVRREKLAPAFYLLKEESGRVHRAMTVEDAFHSNMREESRRPDAAQLPVGSYLISVNVRLRGGRVITLDNLAIRVMTRDR